MQHYPMSAVGFAIDEEVAKQLGLSHEYEVWDSEWDYDSFCMEFDYLYGVYPDKIQRFEYSRGGEVQGLSGFEYDCTYVIFDESRVGTEEWLSMLHKLEEHQVFIEEGSWSELG